MNGENEKRRVIVARHAGFCFGVRRPLRSPGACRVRRTVYTLGPIIHNPEVVSSLAARGVLPVEEAEQIPADSRVIIRSHGVGRAVMEALKARGLLIEDATCPFVKRIHDLADIASSQGRAVIVVGEAQPPPKSRESWAGRGLWAGRCIPPKRPWGLKICSTPWWLLKPPSPRSALPRYARPFRRA